MNNFSFHSSRFMTTKYAQCSYMCFEMIEKSMCNKITSQNHFHATS